MRCSIVTCAAVPAIAGTSVTAVAPLPIDDDPLAGVVEVGGPLLRVHDPPAEVLETRERRGEAGVVAVVARAQEQEAAGELVRVPSPRRTVTVQRAWSLDHCARTTVAPNRIRSSTPNSRAVSRTYSRIDGPSAMPFVLDHGRKE